MKRTILFLALLLVLAGAGYSLEFWLGFDAYYNDIIQDGEEVEEVDPKEDFSYGPEARLYLGPLMGSVGALYTGNGNLLVTTDIGVSLKLIFLRFGLGVGPNFAINLNTDESSRFGGNIRATADIELGGFALGLSWMSFVDFTTVGVLEGLENPEGYLGLSVLFRL